MGHHGYTSEKKPMAGAVLGVIGGGAVTLLLGLAVLAVPRTADALPSYTQQTGLTCGACHVNPAGGGPRNAFGKAFAANGHKVPTGATPPTATAGAPGMLTSAPGTSSAFPLLPHVCYGWCPKTYE